MTLQRKWFQRLHSFYGRLCQLAHNRSREQDALELVLIVVVIAIMGLIYSMPNYYKMVALNLYFLPVAFSGFYLGRYRAGVIALLSVLTAVAATVFSMANTATPIPAVTVSLAICVWGAVLGLTALLIGTLSDDRNLKMQELQESHRTDTLFDALTGIANRRAFEYELARRMAEWNRHQTPFSLIMIDVDHFKKFNDTYGHSAGDAVLRGVAKSLQRNLRESDLIARYGGEEFGLILPSTGLDDAKETAERSRSGIETARFPYDGMELRLTVSVGVAQVLYVEDGMSLLQRADAALYTSKQAGRNCSHLHNGASCEHFGASLPSIPTSDKQQTDNVENSSNSYFDGVTGLPSRIVFVEEFRRRTAEAQRYNTFLSLMLIRIDRRNDLENHGALAVEKVISIVGEFIRGVVRDVDLVAYYNTCEFAVLMPCTALDGAAVAAERLRRRIAECRSVKHRGSTILFTTSIGIAELIANEDAGSVIVQAEAAVQTAMDLGGNQALRHDGHSCYPVKTEVVGESRTTMSTAPSQTAISSSEF